MGEDLIMSSVAYSLNKEDLKKIGLNILVFNVPAFILTMLTALKEGTDLKTALITASFTLVTALIDIIKKFVQEKGS